MRRSAATLARLLVVLATVGVVCAAEPVTLVAWAPGFPGTTDQAQSTMDDFASGVARAAGWDAKALRAVYDNDISGGLERLAATDVVLALVPLPVFLEFGESLSLRPLLRVIHQGGDEETWTLVAAKGAVSRPQDLAGWRIEGLAGFSSRFVRRVALGRWGELPATTAIAFNGRVLSVLRQAARGEKVAALLDRAQAEAMGALPFAADLEVLAVSPAMVSSVVCAVGERLTPQHEQALVAALLSLSDGAQGSDVLSTIRVARFVTFSGDALENTRRSWGDAGR